MSTKLTRHHKVPRSHGGSNESHNLKMLPAYQHQLWHKAWDNKTPTNIVHSIEALIELFGDIKLSELKLLIEIDWS